MIDLRTAAAAVMAIGLAVGATAPAFAETAGERLFFEGALAQVAPGAAIIYEHQRDGSKTDPESQQITDGEISVTLRDGADGTREAMVAMSSEGKQRELHPFPVSTGNPMLLIFLESSLRAMAGITGGSPFYIRNRVKESLRSGGEITPVDTTFNGETITAEQIVFHPFREDKNRERMGDFAELELRFVLSEEAPGGFILFSATTPKSGDEAPAFREEISFLEAREKS